MHAFKYQFKLLIRNKMMIFWTILFPLILGTFFNLAFSNLTSSEGFDPAKVAIIENQENEEFIALIESLSKDDENQLLEVQYVDEKEAAKLLEDEEISGYLTINDKIELTVSENGISQTIIQTVVDNYYQITSTMTHIYELNPSAFMSGVLDDLDLDRDNFQDVGSKNTDLTVIYFYTLIGMTCMNGGLLGLKVTTNIEANLSRKGTRVTMAPTSKYTVLFGGLLSAFIIQFANTLILLAYLVFGLGISFGDQIGYIILLCAVGGFVGLAIGNLVGNALKVSEDTKISIVSSMSTLLSFFSGMMVIDIKYLIMNKFPIASYINPVSLITDALYSLYYYTTNDRYFFNLLCLMSIGIVVSGISLVLMRKKKYDSI